MLKSLTVWITIGYGKFLKRWEYQTALPVSSEDSMHERKQQLEPDMDQRTDSKSGKEYLKAVHCHPAYLTSMQSASCKMLGWMTHRLESRLPINNLRYANYTTLMAESKEGPKEPLHKGESEKVGLKLNIQSAKIMASGPISSWQINGEKRKQWFPFLGLQNHHGWCSHEIKRLLLLGKKAMKNLDNVLKSRDITLPKKVHIVQAMVFPVVMYGCESWTIKKAECWRIEAFELWYWRRFLRISWTAERSNQSVLKEISPKHSLEELMLKLKLQYFGHLMQRANS